MAYCSQCGMQLPEGAAFCSSCGTKTGNSQNTNAEYRYDTNGSQYTNYSSTPNDVEDNKLISILCYFGILFLIPYLTRPGSPFVKFHSNQGFVLLLFFVVSGIASSIPILGWITAIVCGVFGFVCFVIGIVNVCNGEMKELPLIGQIQILK
ncbi:MAG: zinc-ribbon domain-containing protein [Clostridiales bacterium]|jgi:uncharacterized membrane protein|nr:zinc-ribbon domain-containing protein [Clostridiales bacterium]